MAAGGASRDPVPGFPGEVQVLYLLEEWHGHGLGRRLLIASWGELERLRLTPMQLLALVENPNAGEFYRRAGAVVIEDNIPIEIEGIKLHDRRFAWTKPPFWKGDVPTP